MFDGDPQGRVKDRDRDRAVYVIEAALRNGQISQADRDLRVQQVQSAATLGELDGLVRDIAALPAPVLLTGVPLPTPAPTSAPTPAPAAAPAASPAPPGPAPSAYADPYGPGSTPSDAGVPSDLYGPPHPHLSSKTATLKTASRAKRRFRWVGILAVLLFAAPGLFGGLIAAFQSHGGTVFTDPGSGPEPVPSGPPFVLNGAGIRDYVSAYHDSFSTTQVIRAVFYDGYVVAWLPQGDSQVSIVDYRDGAFDPLGDPMDRTSADTAPIDLADLKPAKVMKLVRTAQQDLGVPDPSTTYVIYDRSFVDSSPEVSIYITNDAGADGFLVGDLNGNVTSKSPATS